MKNYTVASWVGWVCVALSAGCLDILGFQDPVQNDCAPKGCGGAGGTGGMSGTGANTMSSASTGGSQPFACTPFGEVLDVFPDSTDEPLKDALLFAQSLGGLPTRAHAFRVYDKGGGHVHARTVKTFGMLGEISTWDIPPGGWAFPRAFFGNGRASAFGYVTNANGPVPAELRFALDGEDQIPPDSLGELVSFGQPDDCPNLVDAAVQGIAAAAQTDVQMLMTLDDCNASKRRLYHVSETQTTFVREADIAESALKLAGYARFDGVHAMVAWGDGRGFFGSAQSPEAIPLPLPVEVVSADTDVTLLAGMTPVSAASLGLWWLSANKATLAPVTVHAAAIEKSNLAAATKKATYSTIATHEKYDAVPLWSHPSTKGNQTVFSGVTISGDAVRLTIFGSDATPLVWDYVVASGQPGQFLSTSVTHFGSDQILVGWVEKSGTTRHYRARAFSCQ
ncbi:MAG: hypothetical protein IPK82_15510 [Polyangiaceae bacterium]|nr:hypothetical protein [Polyangiaceae bacterium]